MHINLQSKDRQVLVDYPEGELLSEVCMDEEFFLNMHCGGGGTCGHCTVNLIRGSFLCGHKTITVTDKPIKVLACKTRLLNSLETAEVYIPSASLINNAGKIEDDFILPEFTINNQITTTVLDLPKLLLENNICEKSLIEQQLYKVLGVKYVKFPLDILQNLSYVLAKQNRQITISLAMINGVANIIDIKSGMHTKPNLAVAIDIGTTTVVGILIDLNTGKIFAKSSKYNQQIKISEDISSRISYCEDRQSVVKLHSLLIDKTINPILDDLYKDTGFEASDILSVAVSGNTVMTHLFLAIDPTSIGKIPFNPIVRSPEPFKANTINLNVLGNAIVYVMPSIAGYIGGDITADLYVANLSAKSKLSVLVDIGTNGEMALCVDNKIIVCATPAGPAFEGAGLYQGCRASYGAIESITINGKLDISIQVIGDSLANGICGSAIIDFIAQARKVNLVNMQGRFDTDMLKDKGLYTSIVLDDLVTHACIIVPKDKSGIGVDIVVTEADISKILQAKAAIFSGIYTLLQYKGFDVFDIDRFVLAGGFSKHINLENAKILGLIPEIPNHKIEVIGNGSLAGAYLSLVDADAYNQCHNIAIQPEVIELNLVSDFNNNFVEALMIPHLDENSFPLTFKLLDV